MINETQRAGIGSYAGRPLGGPGGGDEAGGAAASEASKELGGNNAAEGAAASQGASAVGQVDSVAPASRELQEIQKSDTQNQAANASPFQKPSFVG